MAGRASSRSGSRRAPCNIDVYKPNWTATAARKATSPRTRQGLSLRRARLSGVCAQAARADPGSHGPPGDGHAAHLEVGFEPPVDPVLGVTHVVSVLRLFAADRAAFGHEKPSGGRDRLWRPLRSPGGTQLYHLPFMASKTTTALGHSQPWGRIEVFPSAVAAVAGHAALRCYGIAGMSARGLR